MPKRPKRPCSHPGCPKLTDGRFCEEHAKLEAKRYEQHDRDPATRRRYGRAWKRIRCVSCASGKVGIRRWSRYTTSSRWRKAALMPRTI
jgi:hypothetical protein